jgi:EpsI family protein
MNRRHALRAGIGFGLMTGASAASVFARPTRLLADTRPRFDLETGLPKAFGDWVVDPNIVPIPPSPDQAAALNKIYDQIVSRTYVNARGQRVMMSITYGSKQNQEMRAHRQEVCYRAQGFRITGLQRLPLTVAGHTLPGARMVASQGPRIEPVTYWFTMGDYAAMSYLDRELVQQRYAMVGQIPDGYLIRLSNLQLDGRAEPAFALHLAFSEALMSHVEPMLRRRLIGSA